MYDITIILLSSKDMTIFIQFLKVVSHPQCLSIVKVAIHDPVKLADTGRGLIMELESVLNRLKVREGIRWLREAKEVSEVNEEVKGEVSEVNEERKGVREEVHKPVFKIMEPFKFMKAVNVMGDLILVDYRVDSVPDESDEDFESKLEVICDSFRLVVMFIYL